MHCKCCDRMLSEKELVWNPEINDWELCPVCLEVALDAAFSDGFQRPDDRDAVEILLEDDDYYDENGQISLPLLDEDDD